MSKTIKVRKGEGPWQVARRAGISLDELYRLNPKAKKMIHPNQELVVDDGTTTTATVKKGEGPWQVAQRMGVSLEDVYKYNPKARKMIYPGDKLTIPIKQGTKKDTDSNQETKSSDTNNTSTNKVANDSINNNANKTNKTTSSPVKGNTQSAPKDTTKTQVAPKDTVTTNNTNTKSTTKQPSFDERMGRDNYYVNKYYRDNTPSKTKPKKDLETTVRQWNARKNNPNRSYRSAYDSYAPAVGPRKVQQTRRLDAIYDLGAAIDIDPTFLSGNGTPVKQQNNTSRNNIPEVVATDRRLKGAENIEGYTLPEAVVTPQFQGLNGVNRQHLQDILTLSKYAPIAPFQIAAEMPMVLPQELAMGMSRGLANDGYSRDILTPYLSSISRLVNMPFKYGGPLARRRLESAGILSI